MNGVDYRDLFSDALEGELDDEMSAEFDLALSEDAELSAEFDSFSEFMGTFRQEARLVEVPDLVAGVERRLKKRRKTRASKSMQTLWISIGILFVLLLLVGFGFYLVGRFSGSLQ